MAWTTPKTWSAGEALTAALMNEQLRDNMNFLKDRGQASYRTDEGSDYTTASTTFVDVDATNLALSVPGQADGHILVGFSGSWENDTIGKQNYFDIAVDGVREGGEDGIFGVQAHAADLLLPANFTWLITLGSTATFVIKLQWKVDGGIATLYAGAATGSRDLHAQFWAHES